MTHLMLTSVLLFALLAIVAIAIRASVGIARDVVDESDEAATDTASTASGNGHGLAEDFGLGLRHATHFAQHAGRSFRRR
ncbi:MAG: hypothetical protein JSR66_16520 [Proteobacteria bacterium]|nr:hypothetical protein [Pseudomonadota bacterium]